MSDATQKSPKLFVANIEYTISEDELYALFADAGEVVSLYLPRDKQTNRPRGFAFVEMGSEDQAEAAISKLHNADIRGRLMAVQFQRPQQGGGGRGPSHGSHSSQGPAYQAQDPYQGW
ncbi:MAG: RNA-binding protein [Vampirovibrionales bacterium]|nr:RNA-binding protein [Vampirovibrionales bacterium]